MSSSEPAASLREVRFEHSKNFPELLQQLGVTILVSTYQAGKLVVIGQHAGQLRLSFHNFQQAMGVAVSPERIAVGGKSQIWTMLSTPDIVRQWGADQEHDACYLTRTSHYTDPIDVHEMAWCENELWIVNTRFSCLCTIASPYSFVPRWKPRFISGLAAEDRCHLNGLGIEQGRPSLVTAMSETDTAQGWRATKAHSGVLLDVESGETVARGFAMPHSPRIFGGQTWLLDSGRGRMLVVDRSTGRSETVTQQPGYTRGLDFAGPCAVIGLSRIRETSTFEGVPIAEQREHLKCGVAIVDLRSGNHLAHFEFVSGVEEIFDVRVLPGFRNPFFAGPLGDRENTETFWYVPRNEQLPSQLSGFASEAGDLDLNSPTVPTSSTSPQHPTGTVSSFERGLRLASEGLFQEAADCFRAAVEKSKRDVEAQWNLGASLYFLEDFQGAIAALQQAVTWDPQSAESHFQLAMALFLGGSPAEAWEEYEWRWRCPRFSKRHRPQLAPRWQGQSLTGRSLLLWGEQGIGDEIMFASCFPDISAQTTNCTVFCDPRLVSLFRRSFPKFQGVTAHPSPAELSQFEAHCFDFQTATGSLAAYLRPRLNPERAPKGYLRACPTQIAKARSWLEETGSGVRVGVSWRGGNDAQEIKRRSTRPAEWTQIGSLANVQLINLQYGTTADELRAFRDQAKCELHHWDAVDPLRDLETVAALIDQLDLVISVDNSTAHLAAALGKPTWILAAFPSASYWRWLWQGNSSGWYESARLFRKHGGQTWDSIFARVAAELSTWRP